MTKIILNINYSTNSSSIRGHIIEDFLATIIQNVHFLKLFFFVPFITFPFSKLTILLFLDLHHNSETKQLSYVHIYLLFNTSNPSPLQFLSISQTSVPLNLFLYKVELSTKCQDSITGHCKSGCSVSKLFNHALIISKGASIN